MNLNNQKTKAITRNSHIVRLKFETHSPGLTRTSERVTFVPLWAFAG